MTKPIDTAPAEHGARFLVWCNIYVEPKWQWWIARRVIGGGLWVETDDGGGFVPDGQATHWSPLPEPPVTV